MRGAAGRIIRCIIGCALFGPTLTSAQTDGIDLEKIPAEVRPFVESGAKVLALESGDLNGDRRRDFVLVLELPRPASAGRDEPAPRSLQILVRQSNQQLLLAKRNDKMILCSGCGGAIGDPFVGVEVKPNSFAVNHYGGSSWRWERRVQFDYSRRDKTWQLVRVDESNFHAGDPDGTRKSEALVPPKHYGKIDIADFDLESFRGQAQGANGPGSVAR